MATQNKGEALKINGMLLKINRNTRSAKGFYYTNEIKTEKYEVAQDNQKNIQLKWSIIKSFQQKISKTKK